MSENAIIVVEVSIPREVIEHRFRDELSPLVPLLWREARAALLELEERAHAQEGLARRRILRRDGRFPELSYACDSYRELPIRSHARRKIYEQREHPERVGTAKRPRSSLET